MTTKPAYAPWPSFSAAEIEAVQDVLKSGCVNYWTGQVGRSFEKEFATFCGTNHAIALANGTVALDLAFQGLRIGAHFGGKATDEVVVTSRTFMASVSSIVNAGALPVFADVDRDSQNINPETVRSLLTENTRAIVCVHLAGWPCDMDGFKELIAGHDIKLIEDCAQAHGTLYKGRPVGGLGDVAAWSFCQDKIMSTGGEGGMVTTNDALLWDRMWSFKDHGKSYDAVYNRIHGQGFRWLHESFGTNWRLTEMQSAIGRIQLSMMPAWTQKRQNNAARIIEALIEFACIRVPQIDSSSASQHAFYKLYAHVIPSKLLHGWTRDRIVAEINMMGVPCMQGTCSEVYLEKAFDGSSLRPAKPLPVAKELGETSIMFLVHPTLSADNIHTTVHAIRTILSQACA
jgi:dTDP-4-amino-4,6-dideoxygalactose transaminase